MHIIYGSVNTMLHNQTQKRSGNPHRVRTQSEGTRCVTCGTDAAARQKLKYTIDITSIPKNFGNAPPSSSVVLHNILSCKTKTHNEQTVKFALCVFYWPKYLLFYPLRHLHSFASS